MNLVEQRDTLTAEQKKLVNKREEILSQLKEVEISIERYNGALIMLGTLIKDQTPDGSSTPVVSDPPLVINIPEDSAPVQ
jgi:hypothetical protein